MSRHQGETSIDDELLAKFVEGRTTSDETAIIIDHIKLCKFCQDAVRFLFSAILSEKHSGLPVLTADERKQVSATIRKCLRQRTAQEESPVWKIVFARLTQLLQETTAADYPEVLAAGDKKLYFISSTPKHSPCYWAATLELPDMPTDCQDLIFSLADANGRPILAGTLLFCGLEIQISNGTGSLSMEKFQANLGKGNISFYFSDGTCSDGTPVLGTLL